MNRMKENIVGMEQLDVAKLCPINLVDGGITKPIKGHSALYNVTEGKYCATVADGYTVVQHKEYFESFITALDNLKIQYTASIKQQGNVAYLDVNFLNKNLKFTKLGEEFTTGVRLVNSYNKTTGLIVSPRFTRLACMNGMVLSRFKDAINARHNSVSAKNYEGYVEKQLAKIISMDTKLQSFVSDCMNESVEWGVCTQLIEKLFTQKKHKKEILQRLGIKIVEKQSTTINFKELVHKGEDIVVSEEKDSYAWIEDVKVINRWTIYNAITHYISHGEQLKPNMEAYFQRIGEKVLYNKVEKLITVTI
jgi:hypothetical protein